MIYNLLNIIIEKFYYYINNNNDYLYSFDKLDEIIIDNNFDKISNII